MKKAQNDIFVYKKTGKIGEIDLKKLTLPKGEIAMAHSRWATHGGVTDRNAHPHASCNNRIVVIHNGIIENYLPLKKNLIKKGHKFVSETDTEVAAHLIEESLKKFKGKISVETFKNAVQKTLAKLKEDTHFWLCAPTALL